jgi:hypothetical protein
LNANEGSAGHAAMNLAWPAAFLKPERRPLSGFYCFLAGVFFGSTGLAILGSTEGRYAVLQDPKDLSIFGILFPRIGESVFRGIKVQDRSGTHRNTNVTD